LEPKSNSYEVIVVADINDLQNKALFEKHLFKEGFTTVEGEPFAYQGKSTTPIFHTRAFIFEVFSKALQNTSHSGCNLMLHLSNNPLEAYRYEFDSKSFTQIV
jgi:hypothetical protein